MRAFYAILSAGLLAAPSAWGHEFWIEPRAHHVAPEDRIEADLRIGEMMTGNPYPFLPDFIVEASITGPQSKESLIGTVGDLPALSVVAPAAPGLYALSYHSIPSYVTFDDLESFSEYLDYEGLVKIVGEHLERQLPDTSISEAYIRNARTLVQVGDIDELDKDRPGSMPFEIIALSNPFTGTAEVSFQLLWRGQPAVDVQMSIFQRPLGDDDQEKSDTKPRADERRGHRCARYSVWRAFSAQRRANGRGGGTRLGCLGKSLGVPDIHAGSMKRYGT